MSNPLMERMYDAIFDGDCDGIDDVIRSGLPANARAEGDQWNFLHMALVSVTSPPELHVVQHLIEVGVDVNARDSRMWTPLHFAVRSRNTAVVKMLISAGADVDPVTDEGISPLHQCLIGNPRNLEIAETLLSAGADPDNDRGSGTVQDFANVISGPDVAAIQELLRKYSGP